MKEKSKFDILDINHFTQNTCEHLIHYNNVFSSLAMQSVLSSTLQARSLTFQSIYQIPTMARNVKGGD